MRFPLERVFWGWFLDGPPWPLCEFVPVRRAADPSAVARSTASTEGYVGFIVHSVIVDVEQTDMQAIADSESSRQGTGDHASRQSILRVVSERDRFLVT